MRERFLRTIQKFRMIEKGDTVLIGVSGGCDSRVLLELLNELKDSWKLKLGILHVNHGLRGKASRQDEIFVRRIGRKLNLPVFATRVDVKKKSKSGKISLEEAARILRYDFFERMAEAHHAQKVALAHTQDDQAETVLMRIISGTGLQGLQAIRPKRKLNGAYLIRPLIEISKHEIRKFATAHRLSFREDRSNRSLQFLRNRIRLKLIPELEKSFNPQVKKTLARLPHLLDVDLSFLEETAELFYRRLARKKNENEIAFPKQSFLQLRPSIQYRLIGRALCALTVGAYCPPIKLADPPLCLTDNTSLLDFDHWNAFCERLSSETSFRLQFPQGLFAVVSSDAVRLMRLRRQKTEFSYELSEGEELLIPETGDTLVCERLEHKPRGVRKTDKSFELFDEAKLTFPLTVRNRRPGDRFQPLGQSKPMKLKGFLINKRILREERDRIPLVVSGNTIIWVAGVSMSEEAKVDSSTKQFVRISFRQRQ